MQQVWCLYDACMVFMVFALCFAGLFVGCVIQLSFMMKLQIFASQDNIIPGCPEKKKMVS